MLRWFRKSKPNEGDKSLSFWGPHIIDEGKGRLVSEDAPPLFMVDSGTQSIALGVFDGLGGSGARIHETLNGQTTAAAHAARLARSVTERALSEIGFEDPGAFIPGLAAPREPWPGAEEFRNRLYELFKTTFRAEADQLEPTAGAVRGTMSRRLPTTACVSIVEMQRNSTDCNVSTIWAGDSRAYIWTPTSGLMQLSRDHTRTPQDAFIAIRQDVPMSNFVGPDVPFFLELNRTVISSPFLILCCSDGAFNYFASPMEFEQSIIECIVNCVDGPLNIDPLRAEIRRVTKDDVSVVLAGVGWVSWNELLSAARARSHSLASHISAIKNEAQIFDEAVRSLQAARDLHDAYAGRLEAARSESWAVYKDTYESLLPNAEKIESDTRV